jgi:hypothetical protein
MSLDWGHRLRLQVHCGGSFNQVRCYLTFCLTILENPSLVT